MDAQDEEPVESSTEITSNTPLATRLIDGQLLGELKSAVTQYVVGEVERGLNVPDETALVDLVSRYVAESNWGRRVDDCVYQCLHALGPVAGGRIKEEHASFMKQAQCDWKTTQVQSMQSLLKRIKLSRYGGSRTSKESEGTVAKARSRWKAPSAAKHLEELRCKGYSAVITRQELLKCVNSTCDPDYTPYPRLKGASFQESWCVTHRMKLTVPSFGDLKTLLSPFLQGRSSSFVPPCADDLLGGNTVLERRKADMARRAMSSDQAVACRQVTKLVCPLAWRGDIWYRLLIGRKPSQESEDQDVKLLIENYHRFELLLDGTVQRDVHEAAANDENYFVFEDTMQRAVLLFLRDTWIRNHCQTPETKSLIPEEIISYEELAPSGAQTDTDVDCTVESEETMQTADSDTASDRIQCVFPPCGFVPMQDLSYLIGPLCFAYTKQDHLYQVFQQLFARYFCFLTSPTSSHRFSLLNLLYLFETLLSERTPYLFEHLVMVDAQAQQVVLPWLLTAFASALPPEQVLAVWDLVVGYDTTEVLAVIAAAIFSFRATTLASARSACDVRAMMADIRSVSVTLVLERFLLHSNDMPI